MMLDWNGCRQQVLGVVAELARSSRGTRRGGDDRVARGRVRLTDRPMSER